MKLKLKITASFLLNFNKILQSLGPILHPSQKAELFSDAIQRHFVKQNTPGKFVFNIVFALGKTKQTS